MKNTGEVQLTLPKLDDGWQWNIASREFTENGGSKVLEVTVKCERGIWQSDKGGGTLPYEVMNGMPIYLRDHLDYDDIVKGVQKQVDDLAEHVKFYDTESKTPADAWKHIMNVFNSQPVDELHLRDNYRPDSDDTV